MTNTMGLFVKDKTAALTYEEERLKAMGYAQVAVTVSSMSVLLSITGSFATGLTYGGPVVCLWGWWLVSLFSLCVALGMAELASAYPTSGGMYYWIYQLVGPSYGPLICWVTGWLNLLGQIASLASTHYFMAYIISMIILLSTGTAAPTLPKGIEQGTDYDVPEGSGWFPDNKQFMGIYTACLVFTATINSLRFEHLRVHPGAAASRLLVHGILGVVFMIFVGWSWVLSLLFCVSDLNQVLSLGTIPSEANGDPIAQIFWNAFKQRTGSGTGGIIMLMIPLGGIYFCAHSTVTYVSRILFAYSRDRAVPLAWLWIKYNKTVKGPLIAVWGTVFAAFLLGLPMLGSEEAFTAIISLSTIALNIAYVAPTTARILPWGARRFQPGVTLLATFALSLIWYYFPVYGAYKWFKGPVSTLEEELGIEGGAVTGGSDKAREEVAVKADAVAAVEAAAPPVQA
ncbi:amino acid carrier 3 [Volvox carteri f. nagariensis]|uniref:Amino acid carrier 3 n=1 Tax=Volvox carteri f. nagariensis TaxID=3068 RepID=D8TPU3_VOLCA|nr:amino acid carrier 3 [Volvox carteri f. nagariensis]EFJ50420.1 amino acid carrier 3 [Volvox carteri f. nagariensis]|eukprot:XP_002948545.1 amino acid carrier 3 [Volvox carteri f. nagariensis]